MKKIISILLVLSFILCISACSVDLDVESQSDETSPSFKYIDDYVNNYGNINNGDALGDIPMLSIFSLDEYNYFLEVCELPDHFITYRDLRQIGDFKGFVVLENQATIKYKSYMYSFLDGDYDITLYVKHNDNELDTIQTEKNILNSSGIDMRRNISTGSYFNGDMEYYYIQGNLNSIEWKSNNIRLTFCSEPDLHAYQGDNPIINKLLNKNEASEIKGAFDTYLTDRANNSVSK